jgi:hypothetical protein
MFDVKKMRHDLDHYRQLLPIMGRLHSNKDLDISNITDEDSRNLNTLKDYVITEKTMELDMGFQLVDMAVCNLHFLLLTMKREDGKVLVYNYFDAPIHTSYKAKNGEQKPISSYAYLQADDYNKYNNIDLNAILPSYLCFLKINDETMSNINLNMLQLLNASDKLNEQSDWRKKLLDKSMNITEWLIANEKNKNTRDNYSLNAIQIRKRMRIMTDDDKRFAESIAYNNHADNLMRAGAFLLIDNEQGCNMCLREVSKKNLKWFKSMPIYKCFTKTT